MATKSHFLDTSGHADSVWIHTEPYSNRPQFKPIAQDIKTDVCVVGSGIAGVSISYELVQRGVKVVMLEARDILSGESGRSSHPESTQLMQLTNNQGAPAVTSPPV